MPIDSLHTLYTKYCVPMDKLCIPLVHSVCHCTLVVKYEMCDKRSKGRHFMSLNTQYISVGKQLIAYTYASRYHNINKEINLYLPFDLKKKNRNINRERSLT